MEKVENFRVIECFFFLRNFVLIVLFFELLWLVVFVFLMFYFCYVGFLKIDVFVY